MADNDFNSRAAAVAAAAIEDQLIACQRDFEDASRQGDELTAGDALRRYAEHKRSYDTLTGANQQQSRGELSAAQRNFLSRRASLGDDLTPSRMKDYALAHTRAVNAGLDVDSPQYFAAVERSVDSMGDGRQPVLTPQEAARIAGVDEQTHTANAARLPALKRAGLYE